MLHLTENKERWALNVANNIVRGKTKMQEQVSLKVYMLTTLKGIHIVFRLNVGFQKHVLKTLIITISIITLFLNDKSHY